MPTITIEITSRISRMPTTYLPPLGMPLYWRNEVSGELPAAVESYIAFYVGKGPAPTDEQIALIVDYLIHYINAPCWTESCKDYFEIELEDLRIRAARLATNDDIHRWIMDAVKIALDPF